MQMWDVGLEKLTLAHCNRIYINITPKITGPSKSTGTHPGGWGGGPLKLGGNGLHVWHIDLAAYFDISRGLPQQDTNKT